LIEFGAGKAAGTGTKAFSVRVMGRECFFISELPGKDLGNYM